MLLDKVCEHLNLLEKDYFSIWYRDPSDVKVSVNVFTFCIEMLVKMHFMTIHCHKVSTSLGVTMWACCNIWQTQST